MLNKVILMGRLTKAPELKYTPSNTAVCSFTVAVDRRFIKQGEERKADFIQCVAWRQTAEFITKYFEKGQLINIVGNIQVRTYDDNGKTRYMTEVIADEVNFCGDGKKGGFQGGAAVTEAPPPDDSDLPF